MATVSKLLNTGVLQTAGEFDDVTLDSLNQGSVYFNGAGHLTVPTSSFLNATNTYTIELWILVNAYPTTTNSAVLYQVTNSNVTNYGGLSLELYASTGNIRFQCRPSTGGTNVTITTLTSIPLNTWTHVAVVVNSGSTVIYINGVQSGIGIVTALDNTQVFCSVGYLNNGNITSQAYFNGYMSNLRVTKGIAVYPDISAIAALTSVSGFNYNTSLLTAQSASPVTDDSSTYPYITNVGTYASNTNIPFAGAYSTAFNGSTNYITNSSSTISNFDTGNFTFECWINSNSTGVTQTIYDGRLTTSNGNGLTIYRNSSNKIAIYVADINVYISSYTMYPSVWSHVAIVRSGTGTNQCSLYIDGILDGTFTCATSITNGYNVIGSNSYTLGSNYFNGAISNLRIVKGTALYSGASFTVPTTTLTAISGTSLLACYSSDPTNVLPSTPNTSSLINPSTITTSNSVIPFAGTYSTLFDGSFQEIRSSSTTISNFGTDNFTFECWAYKTGGDYPGRVIYDGSSQDYSLANCFSVYYVYANIRVAVNGVSLYISPISLADNIWHHIAIVRSGTGTNQCSLYIDGILDGTFTCATSITNGYNVIGCNSTAAMNGGSNVTNYFGGYISNLRIVKGTAVYSGSTITVPTTALTNISGTSLLTCQSSSPTIDVTNNNILVSVPSLVSSTSNSIIPFAGTYSAVFNGNNFIKSPLYTTLGSPNGTNNFTIELWARFNSIFATETHIFYAASQYENNANIVGPQLFINGGVLKYSGSGSNIVGTTTISTDTWYHIAIVRNSGNTTLYLNGNVEGSFSDSLTYANDAYIYFGFSRYQRYYSFDGYISNFRIVRGTAVYTTAFPSSVPTTALTAITGTSLLAFQSTLTNTYTSSDSSLVTLPTSPGITLNTPIPFAGTYSVQAIGGAAITVPDHPRVQLATGDFTIEFWMRPYSLSPLSGIFCKKIGTATTSWAGFTMSLQTTGRIAFTAAAATSTAWTINDTTSMPVMSINTWYHVALVRNGNNIQVYVNGTQYINSTAIASGTTVFDSGQPFLIGRNFPASTSFQGHISNFRIVKGLAVYTGAFTPPTTPLTATQSSGTNIAAISSGLTTLLVAQSPSIFTDNAVNYAYMINNNAVTTSTSVVPFAGTYSNLFNGTTQFISLPVSNFLPQINNTYTIEMWINPSAYPTSTNYCSLFQVSNANVTNFGNLNVELYGTGVIRFEVKPNTSGTLSTLTTTTIVPLGAWTHVAVNVDRGRATIYLNGVASAVGLVSRLDGTQTFCSIGRLNNGYVTSQTYYNGYISNIRVIRGKAIYPDSFYKFDIPSTQLQTTQPSSTNIAAIPTASSVGLLLPFAKSTDDESTYLLPITKSGNSPPSLLNRIKPPFIDFTANDGYNSVYFPGSDAATAVYHPTANSLDFGLNDFTIECWVYMKKDNIRDLYIFNGTSANFNITGVNGGYTILCTDGASQAMLISIYKNGIAIYENNGAYPGNAFFVPKNGTFNDIAPFFQLETWYHIAITRSGNIFRGFINGIEANFYFPTGIFSNGQSYTGTTAIIGSNQGRNYYQSFCGYISNLRVVKKRILYNSNFTPPTTPLQVVTGTSLLICQSPVIKDTSGRLLTTSITTGENPASTFNPFSNPSNITVSKQYSDGTFKTTNNIDELTLKPSFNTGSIYSVGSTQTNYVGNDVVSFGKFDDFTIEAWLFNNEIVNTNTRYFFQTTTLTCGISGGQHLFINSNGSVYTAGTAPLQRWYHYALVRKNNIIQLFIDGVLLNYTEDNLSTNALRSIIISGWVGFVSNLRVVKGIAIYSKSMFNMPKTITVPSTALTATSSTLPTTVVLTAQSSTIVDNSGRNIDIGNYGVTSTNSIIPFAGTYSYQFNTSKMLVIPANNAFHLESENFTFECWLYPTSYVGADTTILSKWGTGIWSYQFKYNNSGRLVFNTYNGGTITLTATSTTITLNSWNHIAFVRSGTNVYMYLNGTRDATIGSNYVAIPSTTAPTSIGSYIDGTTPVAGYISNLRLVKGTALYSGASFTVPTSALSATTPTSNLTKVLTAKSSTVVDTSASPITFFNDSVIPPKMVNDIIPFAGTYSAKFDNNTQQYVRIDRNDLSAGNYNPTGFGSNDFTIECWVYLNGDKSFSLPAGSSSASSAFYPGGDKMIIYNGIIFKLILYADAVSLNGSSVFVPSGGTLNSIYFQRNTWYHIAYTRQSGTHRCFINGVAATASGSITNNSYTSTSGSYIDNINTPSDSECFSGLISNLRLVSGTAVYTTGFTPPTTPLTAISGTTLLTCQSSYFKDNSTNNFPLSPLPVSKPIIHNADIPFSGTYATAFNTSSTQTGCQLNIPNGVNSSFGYDEFSIEFWVKYILRETIYVSSNIIGGPIFTQDANIGGGSGIKFSIAGTDWAGYGSLRFSIGGDTGTGFDPSANDIRLFNDVFAYLPPDTWHHVVMTRSNTGYPNGPYRIFVNGILKYYYNANLTFLYNDGTGTTIGGSSTTLSTGQTNFNGHVSNVRIVKGSIPSLYRTTSTTIDATIFTSPTAALTTSSQGTDASKVVLLTCQSATSIDNSSYASSVIEYPYAVPDNSVIPFAGTYSYKLSNKFYLESEPSDLVNFKDNDFSIEFWVYPTAAGAANTPIIVINWPYGNGNGAQGFDIRIDQGTIFGFKIPADNNGGTTSYYPNMYGSTLPLNTWSHIVLSRTNDIMKMYYNGNCVYIHPTTVSPFYFLYSKISNVNQPFINYTKPCLRIGYDPNNPTHGYFSGYISNLRIVNGTSAYNVSYSGGNFTPPTSVLTLTQPSGTNIAAIANTETTLLLSAGIYGFEDISPNKVTFTGTSTPSYQSPFPVPATTYYSGKFNGTSNYLTVTGTTMPALGTGDFTIEFFAYFNSVNTVSPIQNIYNSVVSSSVSPFIQLTTVFRYGWGGSAVITGVTTRVTGTWYHVAVVKIAGTTKMYVNGFQDGSNYTDSNNYVGATNAPTIGRNPSNGIGFFDGYISNLRVVAGVGVYTGSFSVPTSPLELTQSSGTSIAQITTGQTKLLLFKTSTVTQDISGVNTLVNTNSVTAANANDPLYPILFPVSNLPSANTTLMKQYKNGELKVLNYFDEYNIRYSVTPDSNYMVENNTSVTFAVACPPFGSGTLYWTNAGTTIGTDFSDSNNSGSITITNGVGTLTRSLSNDQIVEGTETLIIQLRTGSTSGPIVATSSTVYVTDNKIGQTTLTFDGTTYVSTGLGMPSGPGNWVCPPGVTSVSVLCIGGGGSGAPFGGGGGGGGALAYINNYAVTPGNSYAVFIGPAGGRSTAGVGYNGEATYFVSTSVCGAGGGARGEVAVAGGGSGLGGAGGGVYGGTGIGNSGGNGGNAGAGLGTGGGGGGGAGGYTGAGGNGGRGGSTTGTIRPVAGSASVSGGGGGSGGGNYALSVTGAGGNGGGVGLLGTGNNGSGGATRSTATSGGMYPGDGGTGGSGGADGSNKANDDTYAYVVGNYGGGGAAGGSNGEPINFYGSAGQWGAIRIMWGPGRAYPSTNCGDIQFG